MIKKDIRIGSVYTCRVSADIVKVRIIASHPSGGWIGTNLRTGRTVRIKTAARLSDKNGPA